MPNQKTPVQPTPCADLAHWLQQGQSRFSGEWRDRKRAVIYWIAAVERYEGPKALSTAQAFQEFHDSGGLLALPRANDCASVRERI